MEQVDIQWFPGHMAKTRRLMKENLPLVDVVVELTDSRVPFSSRNPEMKSLVGGKPRVVVLNKCDMADEAITQEWIEYYKANGIRALATDCRSGRGLNKLAPLVREVLKNELEKRARKGMEGKPIRMMIVGIPNVGKSSFINRIAGGKRAKVEDRPGVTRGKQWVTLDKGIDLLDMPGVLWPKFEDKTVGEHLAFTGAVKDRILDTELLAMRLLENLTENYKDLLVGVNIGGVGTLISSLASLITFREYTKRNPMMTGHYMKYFTLLNLFFLVALTGFMLVLKLF